MEILVSILTILFSIIHGKYDGELINNGTNPKAPWRVVIRGIVMGGMSWGVTAYLGVPIEGAIILALHQCSLFWLVFDITVNQERDMSSFYIGKTKWTDKKLRKLGNYEAVSLKLMVILATGFGYILYIDHITIP